MNNTGDLENYYSNEIVPLIERIKLLNKKVKEIVKKYLIPMLILFFVIDIFLFYSAEGIGAIFQIAFIEAVILYFLITNRTWGYSSKTDELLNSVIQKVISYKYESLQHFSNKSVEEVLFRRSKLMDDYKDYSGNDLITGNVEGIEIAISVIKAAIGRDKNVTNVFCGLFLCADFEKSINSTTFILPDKAQNMLGSVLGSWIQTNNYARGELVKLEDPEFEKDFVVYSGDQIEARYILSPLAMSRISKFKERIKEKPFFFFTESKVFIAVPYYNIISLEPGKVDDYDINTFVKLIDDLDAFITLVKELNSNNIMSMDN